MMRNERGLSKIIVLVVIAFAVWFLYTMWNNDPNWPKLDLDDSATMTDEPFEDFEEPEGTPTEISNEALNELDDIVDSIDEIEDDFSDI
jgi:hypothetical protein